MGDWRRDWASAGARRTRGNRLRRSAARSNAASTGSTPPRCSARPRRNRDRQALRQIPQRHRPLIFARGSLVWDDLGNVSHASPRASRSAPRPKPACAGCKINAIDLDQLGWPVWPEGCRSGREPGSVERSVGRDGRASTRRQGAIHRHLEVWRRTVDAYCARSRRSPASRCRIRCFAAKRKSAPGGGCLDESIGIIACSTLGSGLLTGTMTPDRVASLPHNDWRRRHPFFQEMAVTRRRVVRRAPSDRRRAATAGTPARGRGDRLGPAPPRRHRRRRRRPPSEPGRGDRPGRHGRAWSG